MSTKFLWSHQLLFFIIQILLVNGSVAQSDTLIFENGNTLIGEIIGMEKGVLEIDVSYGDSDFMVRWLDVKEIYTESTFIISLGKDIYKGRLASTADQKLKVYDKDTVFAWTAFDEIVYLKPVNEAFSDRFDAAIELGFNTTKAQSLRQFSSRNAIGYRTDRWLTDAYYNTLRSTQDNSEAINRNDGQLNFRYLIFKNWYLISSYSILSNSEQRLDLRMNSQVGFGKFLYSTNKSYWSVKLGYNNNNEKFTDESRAQNSSEAYVGTVLNLYDIGDLELLIEYIGFTGLDEFTRYRSDANIDLKYELPFDLFIRTGFSINYDNQPATSGSTTSYILRTGIGWEW